LKIKLIIGHWGSEPEKVLRYDPTDAQCFFWLAHHNDSSRWFAISSGPPPPPGGGGGGGVSMWFGIISPPPPPPICCPSFSFMGGDAKEYITKLGCEKYFRRITYWTPLEMLLGYLCHFGSKPYSNNNRVAT
jgi:hypothetical protein